MVPSEYWDELGITEHRLLVITVCQLLLSFFFFFSKHILNQHVFSQCAGLMPTHTPSLTPPLLGFVGH